MQYSSARNDKPGCTNTDRSVLQQKQIRYDAFARTQQKRERNAHSANFSSRFLLMRRSRLIRVPHRDMYVVFICSRTLERDGLTCTMKIGKGWWSCNQYFLFNPILSMRVSGWSYSKSFTFRSGNFTFLKYVLQKSVFKAFLTHTTNLPNFFFSINYHY